MHNLLPLPSNTIDEFDLIRNSKQQPTRTALTLLRPNLIIKYDEYDVEFNNNSLENIPQVLYSENDKNALLHCYTSDTKAKDSLIVKIKDNQQAHLRATCQFCGLNSSKTTDHFLPKDDYPEFCINHKNLIPCCFDCNNLKNEYLIDNRTNTRGIINLYTDQLPNVQYLFITINYIGGVPVANFDLRNINGVNANLFQIIEYHYEKLNLLKRYKDEFYRVYKEVLSAFSNPFYNQKPLLVSQSLVEDANTLYIDFGRNYFKAIIKESLSQDAVFLNTFN